MVIYVNESGSDRTELTETLIKEGVTYQECRTDTTRELGTASWRRLEIQANLPEVFPVPPEYSQSEMDVRAWRLPSGRLIITDMEGNLEQIAAAPPSYGR
ncbi:MAG: hypothetical protein WC443_14355 [Desulfobaccales bacterium]